MPPYSILVYDGACGFCARGVLFAYARDPCARLRFVSLQSATGQRLLAEHGVPDARDTLVLLDARGAHTQSTAVLRSARLLRWPWSWSYAAIVVPRPLRDALYRFVARNRHRLGPGVEACARPSPELRARMLD